MLHKAHEHKIYILDFGVTLRLGHRVGGHCVAISALNLHQGKTNPSNKILESTQQNKPRENTYHLTQYVTDKSQTAQTGEVL